MSVYDFFKTLNRQEVIALRHCRTVSDAVSTNAGMRAIVSGAIDWPTGQGCGVSCLLALLAITSKRSAIEFVKGWAVLSTNKKGALCINESRFLKMITARDWNDFFSATAIGVRLESHKLGGINAESLEKLVRFRAETWANLDTTPKANRNFALTQADTFYQHQRKSYV